uniref:Uncharacterized protein n=1 Tax=Arundo donax TaxID=35708 RepID=A0A0A8Y263_ARUDO
MFSSLSINGKIGSTCAYS